MAAAGSSAILLRSRSRPSLHQTAYRQRIRALLSSSNTRAAGRTCDVGWMQGMKSTWERGMRGVKCRVRGR